MLFTRFATCFYVCCFCVCVCACVFVRVSVLHLNTKDSHWQTPTQTHTRTVIAITADEVEIVSALLAPPMASHLAANSRDSGGASVQTVLLLLLLFCCCCCCCFWTTLDYYCCRHYCQDGAYGPCCGKRAIGRLWETDLRGSQREKKLFRKQIFLKSLKLKFIHDLYKWLNWVFWFCLPVVYPHLHLLSFLRILTVMRLNTPKVFCSETPEVFHFFLNLNSIEFFCSKGDQVVHV